MLKKCKITLIEREKIKSIFTKIKKKVLKKIIGADEMLCWKHMVKHQ